MNSKPTTRYAWYVVFVLMLANISSFIDRQILSLLVGPIKRDLDLSDTQMSLLMGISFALFYTIFGMIIGRLADKYSRRNIIMVGITVWSLMTTLCGGIKTYGQFFLVRMGVGVGEGTLSPSAYSMIADSFPKNKLATAMSVFTLGIFLGSGLALVVGAGIISKLPTSGMIDLPILGTVYPWQIIFIYIGLPGLLIALLMFTLKEPVRKDVLMKGTEVAQLSISEAIKIIFTHKKAYLLISIGIAFTAMVSYGGNAWIPTYFVRTFDWTVPQAGVGFGMVLVTFSILGVLFGGWLGDYLCKKGVVNGKIWVGVIATFGAIISSIIPQISNPQIALLCFGIPSFFMSSPMGAATAALQEIMPNQVRALASSIFLFILNIIGLGMGPTMVALFTDFVFHDEKAIKDSLSLMYLIAGILGFVCLYAALKPYQKAIENVSQNKLNI